jgi:hypothetical protein
MLASVFLFYLTAGICRSLNLQKYRKHIFFLFLFVLLCFNFINFHNRLISEANYAKDLEPYGLNLIKNFPDANTVFLVGDRNPVVLYYKNLANTGWGVISSGWGWPGQKLNESVINASESGHKTIVVDTNLSHFPIEERKDLEQLLNSYELENASMGLFIIKGLKS